MSNRIEIEESGIMCDNPECVYENASVTHETLIEWIDRPCPNCGQNLLTEEDYLADQQVVAAAEYINSLSDEEYKVVESRLLALNIPNPIEGAEKLGNGPAIIEVTTHNGLKMKIVGDEQQRTSQTSRDH